MSPEVIIGGLGALLIVTAVLGGGFELRELKVPRIGRFARLISAVLGCVCVLLSVGIAVNTAPSAVAAPQGGRGPDPETSTLIHFTVTDELGDAQVTEQVSIVLDGRRVGDLTVDQDNPASSMQHSLRGPGQYSYTLSSWSREYAFDGTEVAVQGSGQGTITIEDGDVLAVQFADNGQSRALTLVHQ
jgi:hypothetical protein